jgi:hypothetical protein
MSRTLFIVMLASPTGVITYYLGFGVGGSALIGAGVAVVGGGLWDTFSNKPTGP